MDLRPQAPEIPSADEVPIDDLLAGVRTTAELNEMIREGLAAARRGSLSGRAGPHIGTAPREPEEPPAPAGKRPYGRGEA